MATTTTQYILATCLQQFMIDKDTQLPLSGGKVYFYKDTDRTETGLKAVYKKVGTPGSYQYVPLPNPVILTPQGTIADDSGNDVLFYYYPYDDNGDVELYYVKAFNSGDVEQWDRPGLPDISETGGTTQITNGGNLIYNGQFLLHRDLAADDPYVAGEIREDITNIAYGLWTFERTPASTAKDIVTFERYGSYITNPEANPRYAFRLETQTPDAGDQIKDLRVKFQDVNFLASETNEVTIGFSGQSNTGSSVDISLILHKYYGTGGSTYTETEIGTFTLSPSMQAFHISFIMGTNDGKTIGTEDDDYLQFCWRFLLDELQDLTMTDFFLLEGDIQSPIFPEESQKETTYKALAGCIEKPNYDGSNLYDVPRLTESGFDWNGLAPGLPWPWFGPKSSIPQAFVYCDGSKLRRTATNSIGIPYQRLYNAIGNYWGSGEDYCSSVQNSDVVTITNNTGGVVTAAAEGATATGFTFSVVNVGVTPGTPNNGSYPWPQYGESKFILDYIESGNFETTAPGTTGFSVSHVIPNSGPVAAFEQWTTVAASHPLEGTFWVYYPYSSPLYYVWYKVSGSGSDPAVASHTGILVNLVTGDSADMVALRTCAVLRGAENTDITCVAATSIPAGAYFTFNTTGEECYVWYYKDQTGSDPAIAGKVGIQVDISSTDTAEEVAQKTSAAIKSEFFQLPDGRSRALVGLDDSKGLDTSVALRYSPNPTSYGDSAGTYQRDFVQQHFHEISPPADFFLDRAGSTTFTAGGNDMDAVSSVPTENYGYVRNTVLNMSCYWLLKL